MLTESFIFTPYTAAYCISFAICTVVAAVGWSKRHVNNGTQIAWLLGAAAVWCFFGIFEVSAVDQEAKILFSKLEYIGGATTPVLFLFFALKYTGREEWLRGYRAASLFVIPWLPSWLYPPMKCISWSGAGFIRGRRVPTF